VDRAALADHPEWIDEAVRAALGRALANTRKVVLERRGGYCDVDLGTPTFRWSGLSIGRRDRALFEQRLEALFEQVAEAEGIGAGPPLSDVPAVLPPAPSEPFDRERGSRFLERYLLDSYDGGTAEADVTGANPPKLFDYVEVVRVFSDVMDPEAIEAFNDLVDDATPDKPLGIIFRLSTPGVGTGWQVVISTGGEGYAGAFTFPAFTAFRYQGDSANPLFKPVPYVPSVGPASAELIDLPDSQEERRAMYQELFGDLLGKVVREQSPKPVSLTTQKYKQLVDEKIADGIEEGLQNLGQTVVKAIRVKLGRSMLILWMTSDQISELNWTGKATLTPITEDELQFRKAKKGGVAGGTGKEQSIRFRSTGTGDSKCPADTIPQEQWGGFLYEPAVEEIGDAGVEFQKAITRIAARLGIPEDRYAGQFCLKAAKALEARAEATRSMPEETTGENKPANGNGNLGAIDFSSSGSQVIAAIRECADIVAELSDFIEVIRDTFHDMDYGCAIHGMHRGDGIGWVLHFLEEIVSPMRYVVYHLFVAGCRSMLLQLLMTSALEIEKRQNAMDRYAPLFEKWIVPQIRGLAELEQLEKRLMLYEMNQFARPAQAVVTFAATATGQQWLLATNAFVASLTGPTVSRSVGEAYEVVEDGGVNKIRDAKGVLWSKDDIAEAKRIQRNVAEGIDPLVKQIQDTPEAMDRFKDAPSIRVELERLLEEMLEDNYRTQYDAFSDQMFAFGSSQRSENIPHATVPYSKYDLIGIHKVTHDQIGDAFRGSRFYPEGIDFLFDSEEGKASLEGFGIMVGMVALCVFVPGGAFLAFGAGVALATRELDAAYQKKRLYKSLINPDLVLQYSEVEATMFLAWFGFALSLLPEVGTATKGLIGGGRAVLRGEGRALGTMAGRAIARTVTATLAEYAAKDLLQAFLKELVLNIVIGEIIQQALSPVIEQIQRGSGPTSSGRGAIDGEGRAFIRMIRSRPRIE
jgi:hypothetical protein